MGYIMLYIVTLTFTASSSLAHSLDVDDSNDAINKTIKQFLKFLAYTSAELINIIIVIIEKSRRKTDAIMNSKGSSLPKETRQSQEPLKCDPQSHPT